MNLMGSVAGAAAAVVPEQFIINIVHRQGVVLSQGPENHGTSSLENKCVCLSCHV